MADDTFSPIQRFMAGFGDADEQGGRKVLITGATGFLGMALVEKLLRTCPGIGTIYLLVRAKKGKEPKTRADELSKNLVFERLHEECPGIFESKVRAVYGDVGVDNLGLSDTDKEILCREVSIVFHSAATLDFESGLKPTVDVNLLGTRRVIEVCKSMPKLKVLVHVSSAFVNCIRKSAEEKLYPVGQTAEKLIGLSQSMPVEAFEKLAPTLMGDHPNTYTLTKALAEYEVDAASSLFPCVIVRPSMITGAWKDPKPGWISSMNGPAGFLTGAAKGILRRLPLDHNLVTDYIPVDAVVSEMIVAAWHTATTKPKSTAIYHCTTSTQNPFRWASIEARVGYYLHLYPLKSAVWYPYLKFLPSLLLFQISSIFVHFLPAIFLDALTKLFGGRPILIKLHSRVNASLGRLKFFIFNEWFFDNSNTIRLVNELSPVDRKLFGEMNIGKLIWETYFDNFVYGVRRYNNKEGPETLKAGRRHDRRLFIIHVLFLIGIHVLVWWLASKLAGTNMMAIAWVVPCFYLLFSFL
ncbi:putative fatty acyl-CoA reductase CG8306 [Ischnura elegans]|uniref:putative fatty acyl-CoA reductase CG8306 n=1 Tax=Ischnura elegans TaxID=197161 RepID=UPI001ED8AF3E|nr:putative fatty acyl-CoA reductase CG8306 [Ischnura elegans]